MTPSVEFQASGDSNQKSNVILINASKNELFTIYDGLKTLHRKLKSDWKIIVNKDEITSEVLSQTRVFILPGSREKFAETEFNHMKSYLNSGGSLLVLLGEGGEKKFDTNINFLLEEYGIMVNSDSVIRSSYYKYFNPKECLISNGVLNRAIGQAAGKTLSNLLGDDHNNSQALSFVYPFGATLNVAKPSVAVLSSGSVAVPVNRPVCAFYTNVKSGGKIAVLGSVHLLSDQYIDKEENMKVKEVLLQFLTNREFKLHQIDADDPEISDYNMVPDLSQMSDKSSVCLIESDDIPTDYTKLFSDKLFQIDTNTVPKTLRSYTSLNVKHETLGLITPNFESPLPPLQPAVFPPAFRELAHPKLELFDLDDAFSSEHARLAQITNKCNNDQDLEYYMQECGDILGVIHKLPSQHKDPKHMLEYIFMQLVEFRKLNQSEMEYDKLPDHDGSEADVFTLDK